MDKNSEVSPPPKSKEIIHIIRSVLLGVIGVFSGFYIFFIYAMGPEAYLLRDVKAWAILLGGLALFLLIFDVRRIIRGMHPIMRIRTSSAVTIFLDLIVLHIFVFGFLIAFMIYTC